MTPRKTPSQTSLAKNATSDTSLTPTDPDYLGFRTAVQFLENISSFVTKMNEATPQTGTLPYATHHSQQTIQSLKDEAKGEKKEENRAMIYVMEADKLLVYITVHEVQVHHCLDLYGALLGRLLQGIQSASSVWDEHTITERLSGGFSTPT